MAAALTAAYPGAATPSVTGRYRLGDVRHVVASSAAAEAGLGFSATIPFDAGMAEFARASLRA
jgi:dTDP-L-rhamnose 4-epimerase